MKNILLIGLLLLFSINLQSVAQNKNHRFYLVTRVIDGDTFRVDDGSDRGLVIRLIGVDAPESRNTGKKLKAPGGEESKRFLGKLIGGKMVRLEYDVSPTDRYGRTLAYVFLRNGAFVNAEMVKNGYATIMTVPPDVKYQDLFLKLERRARQRKAGLWGEGKLIEIH